jgi:50S ribosome-binding GTPase
MNCFCQPRRAEFHANQRKSASMTFHPSLCSSHFHFSRSEIPEYSFKSLKLAFSMTSFLTPMGSFSSNGSLDHEMIMTDAPAILVLGETGAGKSYFINTLAPGTAEVGNRLESCESVETTCDRVLATHNTFLTGTQKMDLITARVGNTDVLLVDTPGFNDSFRSDGDILVQMSAALCIKYRCNINLKGVIYLYNITQPRLTGSALRQLELFRRICGDENLGHVLLVTTQWSEHFTSRWEDNEDQLRDEYWADMISKGAKCMRFEGTYASAASCISQLLGEQRAVLALQREIVDERRKLSDTDAGSYATQMRSAMQEEYQNLRSNLKPSPNSQQRLEYLKKSLEKSREDKEKLGEDVVENVDVLLEKALTKEKKEKGRKPHAVNVVGWILGLVSIGVNLGTFIASMAC